LGLGFIVSAPTGNLDSNNNFDSCFVIAEIFSGKHEPAVSQTELKLGEHFLNMIGCVYA
jgi:hypothetical protein